MPLTFYFNVQLTGSIDTSSTNDSTEDKPRDLEKLKDTLKALFLLLSYVFLTTTLSSLFYLF